MKKIISTAILLAMPIIANAVTPVTMKPVEQRNLPSEQTVRSGPHELPIITWGGDIATIYANGEKALTSNDSIFGKANLRYKLKRVDVFEEQIRNYISGKTPFLRGTMSMINMAAAAVDGNKNLTPVVFYQLTWSAGGDALVVKSNIKKAADLCGKTIALNADGPHLNYANKILTDAGCNIANNNFVWTKDLTGTDESPSEALRQSHVDAAFVIIPDALALTSGGNVGTGSEDSIRGAKILLSTKTANKVIADVYAVRQDYFDSNRAEIDALAASLFKAQEELATLASRKGANYNTLMRASAELLLDAPEAIADTEGLLADASIAGFSQNSQFFTNSSNLRNFERIARESAQGIQAMGVINKTGTIEKANLNYALLAGGVVNTQIAEKPKFDSQQVSRVIERRQKQGSIDDDTIFEFEVYFRPNQKNFDASLYADQFDRVVELSETYGGAIITIEGHSDPMGYLRKKKSGEQTFVLNQIKQSAKNLSLTRANEVSRAVIEYAKSKGIVKDTSQFASIGLGISNPRTGICGADPCPPKTEQEWLSNMRVVFRIIQVEAEADVFMPL